MKLKKSRLSWKKPELRLRLNKFASVVGRQLSVGPLVAEPLQNVLMDINRIFAVSTDLRQLESS
jgi:hypothetical protein